MKKDLILEAKNAFLKHLPDPMQTAQSTITMNKTVGMQTVRFIAQKFKATLGYVWGVHFTVETLQKESLSIRERKAEAQGS